jgi:PPOX class probable F420-dependent enzyme
MATLDDPLVRELFEKPYYAVLTTLNRDGSLHSTVVWADLEDGAVAVNSAIGRRWPTNLERDPRAAVLVADPANAYYFVEVRGSASATTDGAREHADRLSMKYDGRPFPAADHERIKFLIRPDRVRLYHA